MSLIVVSGPPRSGTTLVNRMICSSSSCAPMLPECSFITKQIEIFNNILKYSDPDRFAAYFGTRDECNSCFRACIQENLKSLMRAKPKLVAYEHIVLKDPTLCFFLTQAKDLLPADTQFVIVVRNPLGIIASLKSVAAKRGVAWNIKEASEMTINHFFHLNQVRHQGVLNSVHYVRYEDLNSTGVNDLAEFLGFSIAKNVIDGKNKVHDKSDPFYTNLLDESLTEDRIDAWRNDLTPDEIAYVIESFAGVMSFWNYSAADGVRPI